MIAEAFTEFFRSSWGIGSIRPVERGPKRGERFARGPRPSRHADLLTIASGRATIGVRDLRRDSQTFGLATRVTLSGDDPGLIRIPHGVAHGFFFLEPSIHVYAVSHAWDPADERLCRWTTQRSASTGP